METSCHKGFPCLEGVVLCFAQSINLECLALLGRAMTRKSEFRIFLGGGVGISVGGAPTSLDSLGRGWHI